jgi:hypothetical protein
MWVDRLGDLVFLASSLGFSVRRIDQLGAACHQPLPTGAKLEQVSLDKSTGVYVGPFLRSVGDSQFSERTFSRLLVSMPPWYQPAETVQTHQ